MLVAVLNVSRACIPVEYVLNGLSIKSLSSLN